MFYLVDGFHSPATVALTIIRQNAECVLESLPSFMKKSVEYLLKFAKQGDR